MNDDFPPEVITEKRIDEIEQRITSLEVNAQELFELNQLIHNQIKLLRSLIELNNDRKS